MVFVCIYRLSSRGHLRCPSLLQALAQSRQHWKPQSQSWAWDPGGRETLSPFGLTLRKAALLVILCCTEFSVKHLFLVFPSSPAYGWMTSWWWGKWTVFIRVIMLSGSLLVPYLLWLVRTEDRGHLSEEPPWAFLQGKPLAAFRPVLLTQELRKPAMGQPIWFYHFLWF